MKYINFARENPRMLPDDRFNFLEFNKKHVHFELKNIMQLSDLEYIHFIQPNRLSKASWTQYCLIYYMSAGARENDIMFLAVDPGRNTTIECWLQTGINGGVGPIQLLIVHERVPDTTHYENCRERDGINWVIKRFKYGPVRRYVCELNSLACFY